MKTYNPGVHTYIYIYTIYHIEGETATTRGVDEWEG